jgi:hypothetical protein
MALYERLISRGIAEADDRKSAIDHVTARRLTLWLLPRAQDEPDLMRELIHFARTGGITNNLRVQLRRHARSASPLRPHAARLLDYAIERGPASGRIGDNFGAICDQIDQADATLEDLRARTIESRKHRNQPVENWQGRLSLEPVAMARRDGATGAVTFILDAAVAETAVNAIRTEAMQRENRVRQIKQESEGLARGSYGRQNRELMIAHESQVVEDLRAVDHAYQAALELRLAPELRGIQHSPRTGTDYQPEME